MLFRLSTRLRRLGFLSSIFSAFSRLWQVLKRHLSASAIKSASYRLYRKAFDMVKGVAKRDDTKAYISFTLRICKRILFVLGSAWSIFVTLLAVRYLGQGLSLLIEGWSGTMTIEFETAWILMATKIGLVALVALFAAAIIVTVDDFTGVRRRLKTHADIKDSGEFVIKTEFDKFRGEVWDELSGINARLDNIEHTLSTLVKMQKGGKGGGAGL